MLVYLGGKEIEVKADFVFFIVLSSCHKDASFFHVFLMLVMVEITGQSGILKIVKNCRLEFVCCFRSFVELIQWFLC